MSKKLLLSFFSLAVIGVSGVQAQSKLIHYWHFNNDTAYIGYTDSLPAIRGVAADFSTIDTAQAKILYAKQSMATSAYRSYVDKYTAIAADNDTFNARMGELPGRALRTRNPSDSMELRMYIPTTKYKNIKLKFAVERSNNGPQEQVYDYSLDSGATWKTSGLSVTADSPTTAVFSLVTESFSDTLANNNAKLVFRVKFQGLTTGTSGNNRFDNVTVEGDTIITAIVNAVTNIANDNEFTIFPNPASGVLNISAPSSEITNIVITNLAGTKVKELSAKENNIALNIADLATGMYFISVQSGTGTRKVSKFQKN